MIITLNNRKSNTLNNEAIEWLVIVQMSKEKEKNTANRNIYNILPAVEVKTWATEACSVLFYGNAGISTSV